MEAQERLQKQGQVRKNFKAVKVNSDVNACKVDRDY
jgi:hypothetical protein